ncbi:hypothetical protein H7J87_12320 [Mycolicibacterium wolinskyi]|uniref:Uncharacterized protein n=1 Tax=Mycolicibacterium wolinskyi TaxID=59750 RepID=A0A1X2FJC3_9MYCO|nr:MULTISPECIES: hypothetical protein [Mycolicibacterium]MCV7286113.1 hypothetical protein [Mycolicibacterium wolinskyi]MCV7296309.1 hypothetical protein [Mycolicibacterium goodii]ORX18533.1 hypothetical protein AWC31_14645 [Mycolicibacterium wolinskyi]
MTINSTAKQADYARRALALYTDRGGSVASTHDRGECVTFNGGWLHAIAADEDVFTPDFVTELQVKAIGDSIRLTREQLGLIIPSAERDPAVAGPGYLHEEYSAGLDDDDRGVLLYVEISGGSFTVDGLGITTLVSDVEGALTDEAGGDCTIRAVHHPDDAYGAPGTPLRTALNLLEGWCVSGRHR